MSVHTFKVHVSTILLSHCVSVEAKRRERVPGDKKEGEGTGEQGWSCCFVVNENVAI